MSACLKIYKGILFQAVLKNMGLKITLKPGERMIIDGAVITNAGPKCHFIVENNVPILREKDILSTEKATTPAKRIYFAIQLMYIDNGNLAVHHNAYWDLVRDFLEAAPRSIAIIDKISNEILQGNYYPAMKTCKKLIAYEEEVISRVQ
ncbi:flagellar biosynthesis repressor FlbT [Desulfosarcina cetonica]